MRGGTIALLLAALAGVEGAGPCGVAQARAQANPFLQMGAPTQPPRGVTERCGARPGLCAACAGLGEGALVPGAAPGVAMAPAIAGSAARRDGATAPVASQSGFGEQPAGMAISAWRAVALIPPPGDEPVGWAAAGGAPGAISLFGRGLGAAILSSPAHPAWDLPLLPALTPAAQPLRLGPGFDAALSSPPPLTGVPALARLVAHPPAAMPAPPPEFGDAPPESAPADAVAVWRKLLGRVNARVNARVYQQSDLATYGVPELWRPSGVASGAVGDCEDLALEKRVELLASHFPPERLFLAVVWRRDVGLHTVLVARLDGGDVVLDSRVDFIERWDRAGYSWVSLEMPGQPREWREAA